MKFAKNQTDYQKAEVIHKIAAEEHLRLEVIDSWITEAYTGIW